MNLYAHPQTMSDIDQFLANPNQALLLTGATHAGKGYLARYLSKNLLGNQPEASGLRIYDGANSGIDDVREIIGTLKYTTLDKNDQRIIIIENIDQIGHEAQNALLKILEEPPKNAVFIATTSEFNSVLPTVVSRMNQINVRSLTLSQSKEIFEDISNAEEIAKAYHLSSGAPALMANILKNQENELLEAIEWAKQILQLSAYERLLLVDDLAKNKADELGNYVLALQKVLRASIMYGKSLKADELARRVRQLGEVMQAREDLKVNVSPKLVLSNLFLSL